MGTKLLTEPFVQEKIIKHLNSNGWSRNLRQAELRQQGIDIRVRNDNFGRDWLIEVKGDPTEKVKSPSGSRSSIFNSALGQIITRMHTTGQRGYRYGNKYGIGFPISFKEMILRKLPYDVCFRLNLYVFFVDSEGIVEEFSHKEIKQNQKG